MGNYLETLKNINKGKNRKIENLVFIIILLVALLITLNYVLKPNNKDSSGSAVLTNNTNTTDNGNSNSTSSNSNINNSDDQKTKMEKQMSDILSQISGISEVSVMVTYSQDSKQTPVYNTKESQNGSDTTTEKNVAYNESGDSKTAIIESVQMPTVEGVIIVAKGADNVEKKSQIATAISAITNVPVYKVQVFEKN